MGGDRSGARVRRALAGAVTVALAAGCSSGPSTPRPPGDAAATATASATASPFVGEVRGVPVHLAVPHGHELVEEGGESGVVSVYDPVAGAGVTVMAYRSAFTHPGLPSGGQEMRRDQRVSPPPEDIVQWLREDPALEVSEAARTRVGRLPATQVDILSVRAGDCEPGPCTYVLGGTRGHDSLLLAFTSARYLFLRAPDGTPLAVVVTTLSGSADGVRDSWEPVLASLRIG